MRLPTRNGVNPSAVFLPEGGWPTLLAFLSERFAAQGEAVWRQRMQRGLVLNAQGEALVESAPYLAGTKVFYYRELAAEPRIPFAEQILFENEYFLVADKPHFLPTAPVGQYVQETLVTRLRQRLDLPELVAVHRLDKETAGLVLLSKDAATRDALHRMFRERGLSKIYEAIAPYRPDLSFPLTRQSRIEEGRPFYRRQEVAGEPNSLSHIDLLEHQGEWARYRLQPVTGKTHQLRVHMAGLGLPIRHDPLYPEEGPRKGEDYSQPLQLLAQRLSFTDPISGQDYDFVSRFSLRLE